MSHLFRDEEAALLLGREPVDIDLQEIAGYVTGKHILVTGGGGSIGSELCRLLAQFHPAQLLLLDHDENSIYAIEHELKRKYSHVSIEAIIADIRDKKRIADIFSVYRPSIIFHTAAHKHVPLMEANPTEAVQNNIFGTQHVAECAHEYGADTFVLISTDKAVKPACVMGATKRVAEKIIHTMNAISPTKFVAVRFGNVLGSQGSVVPLFKQQILEGGPVTVTHQDMVRFFMTIREAVELVIQAGAYAKGGEIFILDIGQPVKILDLAHQLIQLSGLQPNQDIHVTYSGVRPGEKMIEEIVNDEEEMKATKHNRILVIKPSDTLRKDQLSSMLNKLEEIISHVNSLTSTNEIRALLWEIVQGG
ncbi:UDP-N-acetylglucosamine 4,6-dehydratase family protein [Paenibacillus sedimenti]|uniref:Polysaccharide biosynthesis protein n=1 Tax=Paenibacillus sedimenti TaxID=2770274 RepID=A0A926KPN5_9BACL|nr:nucleoside-diphosphate sugar epimerase/dehydratase [Paenibacillus sedimenti]MBD0379949.1 polysaccharide biosynthesis protein [Paenibacillus sedimenti]